MTIDPLFNSADVESVRRILEWWGKTVLEAERNLAICVEHRDYWRTRLADVE